MTQVSFRTGARPPKHAPALQFAEFRRTGATAPAQAPSYPAVDYLSRFGDWQVLGNDVASNCGAVWWANDRRVVTGTLTDTEVYPGQDQVWQLYETQNQLFDASDPTSFGGPNDQGMEIQTLLEHLVKVGGPDGVKALGFAQVNHEDLDEVKAAISTGGRLLFVVTVSQAQQEQFGTGQPWDFDATSPVDGQHAILVGGHDDDQAHDLTDVTWGEESVLTDNFFRNAVVQAWLVIWPEHRKNRQFLAGMDLEAFAAAYTEITGRPFPTEDDPAPSPAPVPDPVTPDPPVVPDPAPAPTSTDPDDIFAGYLRDHLVNYPFDWEAVIALRHAAVRWLRVKNLGGEQMAQIEDSINRDREVIESTPVDPNRLHAADQAAQAANDGEYAPSTDARSRHVLEDRAERAAVVADIQAEALDDQRQREGLAGRAGEPTPEEAEAEPAGQEAETGEGEPTAEVVDQSPSAEPVHGAHSTTQDS